MIMFLICAQTTLGIAYSVFSVAYLVLDGEHRLRLDRLHKRPK